jgi:predicted metal-binding protein
MTDIDIVSLAKECGFDVAAAMDPNKLEFMSEVRDMCAADKCRSYDKNWTCPPAAGSLEDIKKRCAGFNKGLLVQTVGRRGDEFDFEAIMETEAAHQKHFRALSEKLSGLGIKFLPMGVGACRICPECTYPGEPCRFPELAFPSMEACGLLVSKVCTDSGVPYYYGKDSISFVSCYLYK